MSHPQPFTIDQVRADLEKMTANKTGLTYRLWEDAVLVEVRTSSDVYGFPSVALLMTSLHRGLDVFHLNTLDHDNLCMTGHQRVTDPHIEFMIKWIVDTLNDQIVSVMPKGHPAYPKIFYSSITTEFATTKQFTSSEHVIYQPQ